LEFSRSASRRLIRRRAARDVSDAFIADRIAVPEYCHYVSTPANRKVGHEEEAFYRRENPYAGFQSDLG
jgi:hypothetical protein